MTLEDWLTAKSACPLSVEISILPDRKLHLLTAAFLRRAWGRSFSHSTQVAVEATEKFTDGRMTDITLARLRVADTLETGDPLWLASDPGWWGDNWHDASHCWGGSVSAVYEQRAVELEQRVASYGRVLPCVKAGIEWPHWVAAKAAVLARDLRARGAPPNKREAVAVREARAQFELFHEIAGAGWTDARWPRWRTTDVRALARGIHRDQAFDRLPILADALQDAGCDDNAVLTHCREGKGHVRGCWVVDLAMGIG